MAEALDKLASVASGKQTAPVGGGKQESLRKAEAPSDPFIRAENEADDRKGSVSFSRLW